MSDFTWAGTSGTDWTTPANWLNGTLAATTFPNGPDDVALVDVNDSTGAIISGGSLITLASLTIDDPTSSTLAGGHVLVGGSPAIGGGGGGTLISGGLIDVTSTNRGGGLVGGLNSLIQAPTLNIGAGAIIGGGGTFDVANLTNAGLIQADGGDFGLGPLVMTGGTIAGPGSLEVDGTSTLELGSATAENIAVNVHSQQKASIVFDTAGLAFSGGLQINNPNSTVNLFFQGQTITGAAFNNGSLVVTGTGGIVLEAIPFSSNGTSFFQVDTSTRPGYGEISILPAATAPGTLLQNDNGQAAIWQVGGTAIITATAIDPSPGPTWSLVGSGAFVAGDVNDLVWQSQVDGSVALWTVDGTTSNFVSGAVVANPGSAWQVKGTGDFFGNGDADILFQNQDGSVAIWDMINGTTIASAAVVANPGAAWHVQGTGNFNNDGKTDIALQNDNGSVAVWNMDGNTIAAGAELANPGTAWNLVSGSSNMRFITGGAANETLTATPTMPNEFVFNSVAAGLHTVAGFAATQDIIELSSMQFASFSAVQAATTATPNGAMISLGNSASLLLSGVDPASLHASNFALA